MRVDYYREIKLLSDTLPGLEMEQRRVGREHRIDEICEIIRIRKKAIRLLEDQG